MKKVILVVNMVLFVISLASCKDLRSIDITENKVEKISEKMNEALEEVNEAYDKSEIFVPEILIENNIEFNVSILSDDSRTTFNYWNTNDTNFTIKGYSILEIGTEFLKSSKAKEEFFDIFEKNTKFNKFYIGEIIDMPQVACLYYFIDADTVIFVCLDTAEKITSNLAYQIYDDFQVISLKELEKVAKK